MIRPFFSRFLCFAGLALVMVLGSNPANAEERWVPVSPWPAAGPLGAAASNGVRVVAVGPRDTVLYSEDGVAWSLGRSPFFADLRSVAVHDELGFVAVGDGGLVLSSAGGIEWAQQQQPDDNDLVDVVCSNNTIAVAFATSSIALSEDGARTWLTVEVPEASRIVALATDDDSLVAVGNGIWRSDDGAVWTRVDEPEWARPGSEDLAFQDIVAAGDGFAVLSNSGLLLSTDGGRSWSFEEVPGLDSLWAPWHGDARWRLAAGRDMLVVTAGSRNPEPPPWDYYEAFVAVRSDSGEWHSARDTGPGPSMMLHMNGWWLALPQEYDRTPIAGTIDLETWTTLASELPARSVGADWVTAVASNGEQVLLCAGEYRFSQGWCWTSDDLLNWDQRSAPSLLEEAAWFHGRWLGLAFGGMSFVTSTDDGNWSEVTIPDVEYPLWYDLTVNGSRVVLVGESTGNSVVATSENLEDWQVHADELPGYRRVAAIPYSLEGASGFVALAPNGVVATSADGITWSRETVPGAPDLHDVAHGSSWREPIVAVSWDGLIAYRSKDQGWRTTDAGHTGLGEIWYAGSDFLVSASAGDLLTSFDGEHWQTASSQVGPVSAVINHDLETMIVGRDGSIAMSVLGDAYPRLNARSFHEVPVAAATDGLNGTHWASDIHLANPGPDWNTLTMQVGHHWPGVRTALPPHSATSRPDVIRTMGSNLTGLFPITIEANTDIDAVSAIWTPLSSGAMGQMVPVLAWHEYRRDTHPAVLPYLRETSTHRTNVGIRNTAPGTTEVTLEIRSDSGDVLGRRLLPPTGQAPVVQYTQPTRWFTPEDVDGGYATIEIEPHFNPRWTAWSSVIDNRTGDATFHLAQEPMSDPFIIAAAVHLLGVAGTDWRTDLSLVNPGDSDSDVRISPLPVLGWAGSVEPALITVPAGASRFIADVADALWDGRGAAALLIEPQTGSVATASRTFTINDDGGTYGQGIPPIVLTENASTPTWLPGIREDDDHRTNLGIVNAGYAPVEVSITLYHACGAVLMTIEQEVPPRSLVQLNRPLASLNHPVSDGAVEVIVNTHGARIIAWASVVDNHTGDAVFVPGKTATN